MVENNVKKNLLDNEEEIYVNLNDLVNLRESAELKAAADAFGELCAGNTHAAERPVGYLPSVCTGSTQGNGILLYERVRAGRSCNERRTGREDDGGVKQ